MERIRSDAESPDDLFGEPSKEHLITSSIAIHVVASEKPAEMPREPWIGREYAYQLLCTTCLRAIARRNTLEVSVSDVAREALL